MQRRASRHTGFTLIELLVAVSVLGLMLFLINQLFMATTSATSTSLKQSVIVAHTRSIGEQFIDDFDAMQGPSAGFDGGYLIIVNRVIADPVYPEPRVGGERVQTGGFTRVDQIYFVRDGQGLQSMTPQNDDSFGSNYRDPGFARVFYGHVERTERDGSVRTLADASTKLGMPNSGLDRKATDWILGRQAQLFIPANTINIAADAYLSEPFLGSAVINRTSASGNLGVFGLTDVVGWQYDGAVGAVLAGHVGFHLKLPGAAPYPQPELDRTRDNYLATTYMVERLKVNPAPTRGDFEANRIAQTHGMLAANCPEFMVQFAADLNNDGFMDTDPDDDGVVNPGTSNGNIVWYDGFSPAFSGPDPYLSGTNWVGNGHPSPYVGVDNLGNRIFIFRVDDAQPFGTPNDNANSKWPYMIRIVYRLCDDRGRIVTGGKEDFVDNDHDGTVDEDDEQDVAGRYFEHIIRVPRP